VCNAVSLKPFLGKTHPYKKPQKEKKSTAQLLRLNLKTLFKGLHHRSQIVSTLKSHSQSLTTLNSQGPAEATDADADVLAERRPRPRCIFIKVELLKGVYQFLVVNSMLQSSITQLAIFYASKHLHMFRQRFSSPLLNYSSCQLETRL
jgi:hypothetical protein